jgi:hypothetical protein
MDEKINVTLIGYQNLNVNKDFYDLTKEDLNGTFQQWSIKFDNPYPYNIEIEELVIKKNNQLKLIKHEPNNLRYEKVMDAHDGNSVVITDVGLENIYPNKSITLIFVKDET